ncbi:GAF domain-containing protein [Robiginitalea sp. M366]|uniref:GAF domain-containing protein n=1 Tax=Robiginitalea aestuariiviva TaxID=3036903 RepID=UPI00240D9EE0|nr:GAF domain-containing protein [Robiginitalea aestuariiviva]MDG1571893.1 GAF domain-containing protein [Robiginitalea aestuariiviva]
MSETLLTQCHALLNSPETTPGERLQAVCDLLQENVPHYDWVGFYFRNGRKEELKLGPYAGDPTDHTLIPFGKGICGQVALSNQNFVVPDVAAQDNYIACSLHVKAEIVVPLFLNGENIGQIDIDSHTPDPFGPQDERLLEAICGEVSRLFSDRGITDPASQLS